MPTYEYQCSECGEVIDVFQSIKAAPLRKVHCESCGEKRPVKRLIGMGGAVIFKGSGFYQTDYRSDSYNKSAKAEKDNKVGKDTDSTKEKKSPSKPKSEGSKATSSPSSPKSDSSKKSSPPDKS
ncbi:MAG: FmdB family zinc ribbon protein [Phycisphaerae bacterium]